MRPKSRSHKKIDNANVYKGDNVNSTKMNENIHRAKHHEKTQNTNHEMGKISMAKGGSSLTHKVSNKVRRPVQKKKIQQKN